MKKQLMTMAFGALLISGTAMAVASPAPQDYQNHDYRSDQHDRNDHRDNRDHRDHDDRNRSYVAHDRGHREGWYRRGGHVPPQYRDNRYVVTDWRARHLRQPPRGYHWVRSDNGDFLLVAIASGVIASILLAH